MDGDGREIGAEELPTSAYQEHVTSGVSRVTGMRGVGWWAWAVALTAPAQMHTRIGQDVARAGTLRANSGKMECSLELDRAVYMAGETARVRLTVTNPTHELIEVFDPFHRENAWINLYAAPKEHPDDPPSTSKWRPLSSDVPTGWQGLSFLRGQEANRIQSAWFQPGESRTFEFESSENWFGSSLSPWPGGGTTSRPDKYQVRYTYCAKATAEFEVVNPRLDLVVEHRLEQPRASTRVPSDKRPFVMNALLLSLGERYIVAAVLAEHWASDFPRDAGQLLTERNVPWALPYRRLAEFDAPVGGLALQPVDGAAFEVVWTEASGRVERRKVTLVTDRR